MFCDGDLPKPLKSLICICAFYVYNVCMSPVVFIFESLKFKINANDHSPPHVHVEGNGASVRINLKTLDVMDNETDFSRGALNRILDEVEKRKEELLEEWKKYHEKD